MRFVVGECMSASSATATTGMRSVEVVTFGAGMSSTMGYATAFSNEETHRKTQGNMH
jgi:hypothetical protein